MTHLRRLRLERGLSQHQLANLAHIPLRSICRWESGAAPTTNNLMKLATALGVTPNELLGVDEKSPGE